MCVYGSNRRAHDERTHEISYDVHPVVITHDVASLEFAHYLIPIQNTHNVSTFQNTHDLSTFENAHYFFSIYVTCDVSTYLFYTYDENGNCRRCECGSDCLDLLGDTFTINNQLNWRYRVLDSKLATHSINSRNSRESPLGSIISIR
jgi:hypothetical protein